MTRVALQGAFLLLIVWGVFLSGGNAERWCPFGGVEALHTYVTEGNMTCSLSVSNFYALSGLLLVVFLVRRAFCSFLCPIATVAEWVRRLGTLLRIPEVRVAPWLDRALSGLKYGALVLILYVTWSSAELLFRVADPCYALLGRHGEDITCWAYVVSGAILVSALFLSLPFCRWLCPLAAVMNPLARFALARVRREDASCASCSRCDAACPMQIPVMSATEVKAARCTSCLECIAVCPKTSKGALTWGLPRGRALRWPQVALAGTLLVVLTSVVAASEIFPIASFVKTRGVPPGETATLDLQVEGARCRGSASQLVYFITRDDILEVEGYLRIEVWTRPNTGRVVITYDPSATSADAIKEAIVTPYYDSHYDFERESPFEIVGYAPWEDR